MEEMKLERFDRICLNVEKLGIYCFEWNVNSLRRVKLDYSHLPNRSTGALIRQENFDVS